MKWHAVIPTIGRSDLLGPLVRLLVADGCDLIDLPDNSGDEVHAAYRTQVAYQTGGGVTLVRHTTGTIYQSWNEAMDRAQAEGALLALLNDDVVLASGSVAEALRVLVAHDLAAVSLNYHRNPAKGVNGSGAWKECRGTFKDGGLAGFAFVADPTKCARVDPRFRWWYGDDDLVARTLAHGYGIGLAHGAPVAHPQPSTSGNQMPWLDEAIRADRALFHALWAA